MINRLMALFRGLDRARQLGNLMPTVPGKTKREIRVTNLTDRGPDEQDFKNHVNGIKFLGVTPIMSDGTCWWGCIDIDKYDPIKKAEIRQKLEGLPVIVTQSKSKGLRVYVFFTSPIEAHDLRNKLREMSIYIGATGAEVFPKQASLMPNDMGNPIMLPYYGPQEGCYMVAFQGERELTLFEFVEEAEAKRTKPEDFLGAKFTSQSFEDAPPCIETLAGRKLGQGERNEGFFAFLVYLKKKFPDDWKSQALKYNEQFCYPPIEHNELAQMIKGMARKSYAYPCNKEPCLGSCDKTICRRRKHGIGQEGANQPIIMSVAKYCSKPPIWFLDVDLGAKHHRVQATTEQLQNQAKFQALCMETLNTMPTKYKQEVWESMVSEKLHSASQIEPPHGTLPIHKLKDHLISYAHSSAVGSDMEDVSYTRKHFSKGGYRYFRPSAVVEYLRHQQFTEMEENEILFSLKEFGGVQQNYVRKNSTLVALWKFPEAFFPSPPSPLVVPPVPLEASPI